MKLTVCGLITLWPALLIGPFALAQSAQNSSPKAQTPALTEAANLNAQAIKLFREGKYNEALPLAKRAVELREKELGEDHDPGETLRAGSATTGRDARKMRLRSATK